MAKDTPETKKLNALISKAESAYKGTDADPLEPMLQMVHAFLMADATRKRADTALDTIIEQVVDVNELRVCYDDEIIEMIGEDYPEPYLRIARMKQALHEVFLREHDWKMNSITDKPKKDQRAYLDSLPGMIPYVAATVTLVCFGGHAMPVDNKLCHLLQVEGILEPGASPADAEHFLTRAIKAGEALPAHLALQAWADGRKDPGPRTGDAPKAPSRSTKASSKKKTSKKKPSKKRVAKKK